MVYIFVTSGRDLLKHRNLEEQIQRHPTLMSKNPAKICSYFINRTDYITAIVLGNVHLTSKMHINKSATHVCHEFKPWYKQKLGI